MHYLEIPRKAARNVAYVCLALFLSVASSSPALVYAEETDCTPVASAPGIQAPTGSDYQTYKYNACTGLWENAHYTWSPATKLRTAIDPAPYVYNETTGKWDSSTWMYSPASSSWYADPFSVDQPPAGATKIGGPAPIVATETPTQAAATAEGTGSGTSTTTTGTNNTNLDTTTNAAITNNIGSLALSGSAVVLGNTNGGSALTGDAQAIANVLNLLQSSSTLGSTAATFVANIDGDVQGDLIIDPTFLQPAGNNSLTSTNNLDVNVDTDGVITNNIDLKAGTGDATVAQNTNAGSATTGNAQAVANVVNMLNSMIAAQQSFLGVVNINGNFNGNILMPQSFLDSLIASNAPHQDINISNETLNTINANLSNTQAIDNNVKSTTQSGTAGIFDNTHAGTATSGNAETNVTIFNLSNQQIVGANTMLVFVNVLGQWVGVIMDAPAGATSAAFGGGITNASVKSTNDASITAATSGKITNNITANAASGDATVKGNSNAGNAKSGDAETAVNLANITNSSINLTGWFGILFINVFGNWFGSFGVAQPHPAAAPSGTGSSSNSAGIPQTFSFVPKATNGSNLRNTVRSLGGYTSQTNVDKEIARVAAAVMGTSIGANGPKAGSTATPGAQEGVDQSRLVGGFLVLAGLSIFGVNLIQTRRKQSH
jgi:hypothetical protein